ncbi:MAG: inorganic diphosphatase [Candidatus Saccharimonadales bacterium]
MPDFNKVLTPGDYQNGVVNTVVEIPQGSILKIEWDRQHAAMKLDRVEPAIFAKPVNYGFIPGTLDEDGDELDTLVYCHDEPLPTGVWLEAKILGVMKFEDDGEVDDKIIVAPIDNRNNSGWPNNVDELGQDWKNRIEHHFSHYKDLKKPGSTKVIGFYDATEAKTIIASCIERYQAQA